MFEGVKQVGRCLFVLVFLGLMLHTSARLAIGATTPAFSCDDIEKEYQKVLRYDELNDLTPVEKIGVWQSVLEGVLHGSCTGFEEKAAKARLQLKKWRTIRDGKEQKKQFTPSVVLPPQRLREDGNFSLYDNGVVVDQGTGLEWLVGPDIPTPWLLAKHWAASQKTDGGGWRLPTRVELRSLVQKRSKGQRQLSPLLQTTGWWIWTAEPYDARRVWVLNLENGQEFWLGHEEKAVVRGFAVRNKK